MNTPRRAKSKSANRDQSAATRLKQDIPGSNPLVAPGRAANGGSETKANCIDAFSKRAAGGYPMEQVLSDFIAEEILRLATDESGLDEEIFKSIVLCVEGARPRNMTEAMLVLQMAAVHRATMKHAAALNNSKTGFEIDLTTKGLVALARTSTTQIETLHKLKNGGQQVMRIERVIVNGGGQAVVGNTVASSKGRGEG